MRMGITSWDIEDIGDILGYPQDIANVSWDICFSGGRTREGEPEASPSQARPGRGVACTVLTLYQQIVSHSVSHYTHPNQG